MSSSLIASIVINLFVILFIVAIITYIIKSQNVSFKRTNYFLLCVLAFFSVSLTSIYRLQFANTITGVSTTSFVFVGTLFGIGLGQLFKVGFATLQNRNANRKLIVSTAYFMFGLINLLLFAFAIEQNESAISALIVLSSFFAGIVIGLATINTLIMEGLTKKNTLLKSSLFIGSAIFLGQMLATVPQSFINNSVANSDNLSIQNDLAYLWLISGLSSFIFVIIDYFTTEDIYNLNGHSLILNPENKQKIKKRWQDANWYKDDTKDLFSSLWKISIVGFMLFFIYSTQATSLGIFIFDEFDQFQYGLNSNGSIIHTEFTTVLRGHLNMILALGSLIGAYFGIKYVIMHKGSDQKLVNLSYIMMLVYFILNLFNSIFLKSSIVLFFSYFLLGAAYGFIYTYFLAISLALVSKKFKRVPLGTYYLLSNSFGVVAAQITFFLIYYNFEDNDGLNYLTLVYLISLFILISCMLIYNIYCRSLSKLISSHLNWYKEGQPLLLDS